MRDEGIYIYIYCYTAAVMTVITRWSSHIIVFSDDVDDDDDDDHDDDDDDACPQA